MQCLYCVFLYLVVFYRLLKVIKTLDVRSFSIFFLHYLAGGKYIFDDLGDADDMASSTMTMQMEDFYAAAKDADYMIYNSSIEGELPDLDSLLAKSPLLKKCKAVQDGHVYCTTKNLYQASMELGTMIGDFSCMLTDRDDEMTYMYKLK